MDITHRLYPSREEESVIVGEKCAADEYDEASVDPIISHCGYRGIRWWA